jgi:hypothetical protein
MELDEFMASPIWWQWWKKTCHKPYLLPNSTILGIKTSKRVSHFVYNNIIYYIIIYYYIIFIYDLERKKGLIAGIILGFLPIIYPQGP